MIPKAQKINLRRHKFAIYQKIEADIRKGINQSSIALDNIQWINDIVSELALPWSEEITTIQIEMEKERKNANAIIFRLSKREGERVKTMDEALQFVELSLELLNKTKVAMATINEAQEVAQQPSAVVESETLGETDATSRSASVESINHEIPLVQEPSVPVDSETFGEKIATSRSASIESTNHEIETEKDEMSDPLHMSSPELSLDRELNSNSNSNPDLSIGDNETLDENMLKIDKAFKNVLKSHQSEAIAFIHGRIVEKESGCILAHCMGLGKTMTILAFINAIASNDIKKTLILTKKSVISQWIFENQKWFQKEYGEDVDKSKYANYLKFNEKG